MIGYAFCGSFCTLQKGVDRLRELRESGVEVLPIMSESAYSTDTRFGTAVSFREQIRGITGREPIHTIPEAEPLGPALPLEALVICPCTGNTLAKIANGITDTAVCMAAKAHLRCDRPLVIALASNDAMSANLKNIATLLARKCVFFVPMRQDDPVTKPHSLVADFGALEATLQMALAGQQYRKLFL